MSFDLIKLKDIADITMGHSPDGDSCNKDGVGVPLLNGPTEFGPQSPVPVQYTTSPRRLAKEADLLFCVRGSTTGRMNWADQKYAIGRGIASIRANDDESRYFVKSIIDLKLNELLGMATGSTFPNVSKPMIENLEVPNFDLQTRRKISRVFATIDDKIACNSRMNKVLEQMAQAIFKQWFVDFEFPNENGEPSKSNGGEMVWCEELGKEIPKGWLVDTIENTTSLVSRGIAPKYADVSEKRVINQKCIRNGSLNLELSRSHISKVNEDKQIQFGDILVNSTGTGTLGRVAQVYDHLENYTVDTHITIIRPKIVNGLGYMGCLIKNMQSAFENAATGSTGQTELGREVIKQMKLLIPTSKLIEEFSDIYHSLSEKIVRSQKENAVLANLRDTLLPKLMSGEIDVSEIEL